MRPVKGDVGLDLRLVGFTRSFLEWLAGRGGFVAPHAEKPADAVWLEQGGRDLTWDLEDVGVEKAGFWRANGNKVEDTILALRAPRLIGLAAAIAGVLDLRSTALAVGRDLGDRAQRLKVEGEAIKGVILGKWEVTSRLEQRNDYRWYLPGVTLLGKLGEKEGPNARRGHDRRAATAGLQGRPALGAGAAGAAAAAEAHRRGVRARLRSTASPSGAAPTPNMRTRPTAARARATRSKT